ncbi:MAG: NFACT family protein [archaeon]
MKKELSALDIHYLVAEMQCLVDARIDKAYTDNDGVMLVFYVTGKGERFFKAFLSGFAYVSDNKGNYAPAGKLCMVLRKYLSGGRLRKVIQKEFERIIEFQIDTKEGLFIFIVELFSGGNFILCKEDYTIIAANKFKKYSQRAVRGGVIYDYPKKEIDLKTAYIEDFSQILDNCGKENIVKGLAIGLGLGGIYSEEACLIAGIDKNKEHINGNEMQKLFGAVKALLSKELYPVVYTGTDVCPFLLEKYNTILYEKKDFFSMAIEEYYLNYFHLKQKEKSPTEVEREKISLRLSRQREDILALLTEAEEEQQKGEAIYNKYQLVDEVISSIKKAREKYSWKEIKEKIKGHSVVKEVNSAEGKVVIEIK